MPDADMVPAGGEPAPAQRKPEANDSIRVMLVFQKCADELVAFAHSTRSLGLASWVFGIAFAGTAVGLRFWSAADMTASEFISCVVFASLLVLGGYFLYVMESRGYVKLVSEIAVRNVIEQPTGELPGGSQPNGAHAAPAPTDVAPGSMGGTPGPMGAAPAPTGATLASH
jgi:hypothetical protein